jgi:hypothetical protein
MPPQQVASPGHGAADRGDNLKRIRGGSSELLLRLRAHGGRGLGDQPVFWEGGSRVRIPSAPYTFPTLTRHALVVQGVALPHKAMAGKKPQKPVKQGNKRGPKPEILKIDGDWKDAMKVAMKRGKPRKGV